MKIKINLIFQVIQVLMVIIKTQIIPNSGERLREKFLLHLSQCELVQPLWKSIQNFPQLAKIGPQFDSAIPFFGV